MTLVTAIGRAVINAQRGITITAACSTNVIISKDNFDE